MCDFQNNYADLLKRRRAEFGWSQAEAAKHLGMSQRSYSRYESGVLPKDSKVLPTIEEVFGIKFAVFRGNEIDEVLHACGFEIKRTERGILASKDGKTWACVRV